jgi:glycosyltransferase involved in cell wall biosynthesis
LDASPEYSICITNFNSVQTIRQSLQSILDQIDADFEVVVVDNFSTDGSYQVLKGLADIGRIRLTQARCSRGKGREIAFEMSKGKYIIANMDMDDIFKPRLRELLARYHLVAEGQLLWAESKMKGKGFWGSEHITVAPRSLLSQLGGWRDLQLFEDRELCGRAVRKDKFCRGEFSLLSDTNPHAERTKTLWGRTKWRYLRYREILRIGLPLQLWNTRETWKQKLIKIFMKALILPFYTKYDDPFNYSFNAEDSKYSVKLESSA